MEKIITVLDLYEDQCHNLCYYTAKKLDETKKTFIEHELTTIKLDKYLNLITDEKNVDHLEVYCYPFRTLEGKIMSCPKGFKVIYKEGK